MLARITLLSALIPFATVASYGCSSDDAGGDSATSGTESVGSSTPEGEAGSTDASAGSDASSEGDSAQDTESTSGGETQSDASGTSESDSESGSMQGDGDGDGDGDGGDDACQDGELNGNETDLDCGGSECPACPTGAACVQAEDCSTLDCDSGSCLGPAAGCSVDNVESTPGNPGWADSYSVDGKCYCDTTFDHNIGDIEVQTPYGIKTVMEVCEAIGPGPGSQGHPLYNDIQCGNGPANDAGDEDWCPGRIDMGEAGCCTVGPTWDLSVFE